MGQSGEDAYSQAQQYGTFDLSVDATGNLPLPAPPTGLSPSPPDVLIAPSVTPFPWLLIVIAIVLITVSSEGR